jgi:hypothetical protein
VRKVYAFRTDTHGGHINGLLNPKTRLPAERANGDRYWYTPKLNEIQRWLWETHEAHRKEVVQFAGGDEIVFFDLGDITHGNAYKYQLVSERMGDQMLIAAFNFHPWVALPNVKTVRIAQGTGAHEFDFGSSGVIVERLVASMAEVDIRVVKHGLASCNGVDVDYAHHGPGVGIRDWLKGNILRRYLQSIMSKSFGAGVEPPRIVLRGHKHEMKRETVYWHGRTSDIWVLPSYSGLTDHARKVTQSTPGLGIGMLAFEVTDGRLGNILELEETVDLRTKEEL